MKKFEESNRTFTVKTNPISQGLRLDQKVSKGFRKWLKDKMGKCVNCAKSVMQIFKLTKLTKLTEQIFAESLKSLKCLMQIYATYATYASANFVGKESNESTVRYREWSRIPSCLFRYSLDSILSRLCLASLICLCMLTIGSGNVWGADETLTITRDDVTTANNYGTDSEWEVGTISGKCQIYGTTTTYLQFNGKKPDGTEGTGAGNVTKSRRCWNTDATSGRIKSITMTANGGTFRKFKVFCGTSAATSTSTDAYGTQIGEEQTINGSGYTWNVPIGDDYQYFMVYETENGAAQIASIVVTYEGAPAVTYSVTWKSDGVTVHTDAAVPSGTTVATPSDPSVPSGCTGAKFMGWTATENYSHATDAPGDLFNGTSPTINSAKTYYAVFADPN